MTINRNLRRDGRTLAVEEASGSSPRRWIVFPLALALALPAGIAGAQNGDENGDPEPGPPPYQSGRTFIRPAPDILGSGSATADANAEVAGTVMVDVAVTQEGPPVGAEVPYGFFPLMINASRADAQALLYHGFLVDPDDPDAPANNRYLVQVTVAAADGPGTCPRETENGTEYWPCSDATVSPAEIGNVSLPPPGPGPVSEKQAWVQATAFAIFAPCSSTNVQSCDPATGDPGTFGSSSRFMACSIPSSSCFGSAEQSQVVLAIEIQAPDRLGRIFVDTGLIASAVAYGAGTASASVNAALSIEVTPL